jgi:catechol 2,3-dioxygenase-like lactoylglutathione lyase family enzyme
LSKQHLGSTHVAQIAVVVHDIEESARRYAEIFGLAVPRIITTEPGASAAMTYRGQQSNAQAKLAFFDMGQVQIELIQPLGGASVWQEALDSRGEHVQHIAFWVEGMQRSADFLKAQGVPMVQRGDMMEGKGQYAYFDSQNSLGVTLELLESEMEARAEY